MSKKYIDAEVAVSILNAKAEIALGTPKDVFFSAAKMVNLLPAADVVEIKTLERWLYDIAINNVGVPFDGDFSQACEKIISRLDGLRTFAKEDTQ